MRKLIARSVVALVAALSVHSIALAQQAAPTSLDWPLYNSTTAGTGLAISVGPLTTANAESVVIDFANAGAGARSAYVDLFDPTGLVSVGVLGPYTVAATSGTYEVVISLQATGTAPSNTTFVPIVPPYKIGAHAAAATGQMTTIVRKRTGR